MISVMRQKFGPVIVGGIIGLIAFVFVFTGILTPDSQLSAGAVAGSVNGDHIFLSDFQKLVNRRMEMFRAYGMKDEQLRAFRIEESVFRELVNSKLVGQEADRLGLSPSAAELRDRIQQLEYFQNEGKFDVQKYRDVLAANGYTPAAFEQQIAGDLKREKWQQQVMRMVNVSRSEIEREFLIGESKVTLKYVLLPTELGQKALAISQADVDAYLKDPARMNLVKGRYEPQKESLYKGKSLESVQAEIARGLIASERSDQAQKIIDELASKVQSVFGASNASDVVVNQLLSKHGEKVRRSDDLNAKAQFIPGVGEAPELIADITADPSPIDAAGGGKPKLYRVARGTLIALMVNRQKADLSRLSEETRLRLTQQIAMAKQNEIQESWLKRLNEQAKVTRNPTLFADAGAER